MVAVRQTGTTLLTQLSPDGTAQSPLDTDTGPEDFLLRETQYLYSLVLLVTFVSLAAWYSVYNAKKDDDGPTKSHIKGPGGKPLPATKKAKKDSAERKLGPHFDRKAKNIFRCLAAIVFLLYIGNATSMFVHAFRYDDPYRWSKDGLSWAGEWTVVSRQTALDMLWP